MPHNSFLDGKTEISLIINGYSYLVFSSVLLIAVTELYVNQVSESVKQYNIFSCLFFPSVKRLTVYKSDWTCSQFGLIYSPIWNGVKE